MWGTLNHFHVSHMQNIIAFQFIVVLTNDLSGSGMGVDTA